MKERILYHACEASISYGNAVYHIAKGDISLKIATIYGINQLERSATSIGANIREAKYAHSKADFISKLQIALKECYETEYWLELMQKSQIFTNEIVKSLLHDCGAIRRILISSINTTKSNM